MNPDDLKARIAAALDPTIHDRTEDPAKVAALAAFDAYAAHLESLTTRLQAAEGLVRRLESCDYREHGDYVKARELELWQERAEDLVAGWDDDALKPASE